MKRAKANLTRYIPGLWDAFIVKKKGVNKKSIQGHLSIENETFFRFTLSVYRFHFLVEITIHIEKLF